MPRCGLSNSAIGSFSNGRRPAAFPTFSFVRQGVPDRARLFDRDLMHLDEFNAERF